MNEAEMIFKTENVICSSPKHSVSRDSLCSLQFWSSSNKLNREAYTKFSEYLESPSSNSPNEDITKKISSNDLAERNETSEKIFAEAAYSKTNNWKR